MILERLAVTGFRTFTERFTFIPDARFTVIHAPNGTGKSTLLDALYYGLLERHSISGNGAEQRFKSIGRELTPAIEIDFAVAGTHYRLRKTFLSKTKSANLQRLESGRYVGLKDGISVDDFVRDLFFAEAPGRGAIDPSEHLGFAHVLWAPARASFGNLPGSAGDQIRAMLGGVGLAVTNGERIVQERVAAEHGRYFKSDGGFTAKAGSANIPALVAQATRAHESEVEARQHYLRLDKLGIAFADREAEAQRMLSVRSRLRTDIEAMKDAVSVYNRLENSAERAARAEAEARASYEHITKAITSLQTLRAQHDVLQIERETCARHRQEQEAAAAVLHARFSAARKAVEDAGATFAAVQRRARHVTAARSYVESRESVRRLETLLAAFDEAAKKFADLSAAQSAVVAPSRTELENVREATAQVDAIQAMIAASALSLEIEADQDLTIDVITGENAGPLRIAAGNSIKVAATDEAVVVYVPGLGRLRASGADGAAKARKKLSPFVERLAVARERFGTSSIPELVARTEYLEDLLRSTEQTRAVIAELLGGQSIEHVREALAEALVRVASIEGDEPAWSTEPPDAAGLRASFDRDLQAATDAAKIAQIELTAAERPKAELDASISHLKTQSAELVVKFELNAAQRKSVEADGFDDEARASRASLLALSWSAAKAEQTNIAAELSRFVEHPQIALNRLEEAERDAGTEYEKALGDAKTLRAQLDMQASLGSYAKLVAAEEHVAHCESDLAAAQTQAAAIACLSRAFERIQAERVASVLGPVTVASTRYLTRIAGTPMGRIDIGEGLSPSGLIDQASGLKLQIDGTLSTGEKEQIYLATRLALAEVIAKDRGRQLFVVDDAMTATDPNRLRRFVGILEELSREHLQIVVTTADPSRYLGIAGAKHIDLAAALIAEFAA